MLAQDFFRFHGGSEDAPRFAGDIGRLSIGAAYEAQHRLTALREEAGEHAVGYKVGCTSQAVRDQYGLSGPVWGRLMGPHIHHGETTLSLNDYAHCAVEPEFVFMLAKDVTEACLAGGGLAGAIEYVAPGIEVHRYTFRYGPPTIQEVIASNGMHACLVIGPGRIASHEVDLDREAIRLCVDGELAGSGTGVDILGGPLKSLAWLARALLERGAMLRAGDLVIPGSATPLIRIDRPATVTARFSGCGTASARFV